MGVAAANPPTGDELARLLRVTAWQWQPASEKQRSLMRRLGVEFTDETSAGEASYLIGRALGRLKCD